MSIEKARKQAFFAAIVAIVVGVTVVLAIAITYARYGNWLNTYSEQESNPAANAFLVKAVKAAGFRLVPGLSVLLVASGASTLIYLKKQQAAVLRTNGG